MASRRDQLQSHQFLSQRVISALVMRETDPPQSPLRRGIGAAFAGVMISVMVAAGFGVYGLLTKTGGDDWKTNGSVVIERDTGAAYVFQDGELHPMLNYASALLVTGSAPRAVFREPASALGSVPRGVMLGIPGAPDSLPDAAHVVGPPWTVCSVDGTTSLVVASAPPGATSLGDRGLLVGDPATGGTELVWHGTRYAVAAGVLPALFGVVTPTDAGAAWLNAIPQGPDIAPTSVPGSGEPSAAAPGYDVGQLLSTQVGTGGVQYWMVVDSGLAPITELQKDIAVSQGAADPQEISQADATAIHRAPPPGRSDAQSWPSRPPQLVPAPGAMCATFRDPGAPTVSIGGVDRAPGIPTGGRAGNGAVLVDRMAVPPGRAAVVRVMASANSTISGYYLVTDLGFRYAVATDDVLKMLGYRPDQAVAMPSAVVALIPSGPALDPTAAAQPATTGTTGG
ncbi:MAG TPA: type VII secretion protein EccB [Micromonosporaceae bacterium]|nr:type VII secretion protein EccB [Micromonosporaceae bacterium]